MAGFGASGRNGGWCSALFPASMDRIARTSSPGRRDRHAARDARHRRRGRRGSPRPRARHRLAPRAARSAWPGHRSSSTGPAPRSAHWPSLGVRRRRLPAARCRRGTRARSAPPMCSARTYTPHCAAIHPARLVRGLGRAVESPGVRIYEAHPGVRASSPAWSARPRGDVRAPYVVRATEGLHRHAGRAAPGGPAGLLADAGDRAAAGRGLGPDRAAPRGRRSPTAGTWSSTGSAPPTAGWPSAAAARPTTSAPGSIRATTATTRSSTGCGRRLSGLFPEVAPLPGHPLLGRPARHRRATGTRHAGWTGDSGLAWAGGYVGDGVGTSNLAGRTLADLITGPAPS